MDRMRVCWQPEEDLDPFYVPVESPEEAKKIMDIFQVYDLFQFFNFIKSQCNSTAWVEMWDDKEQKWNKWKYDNGNKCYNNVDDYCEDNHLLQTFFDELEVMNRF